MKRAWAISMIATLIACSTVACDRSTKPEQVASNASAEAPPLLSDDALAWWLGRNMAYQNCFDLLGKDSDARDARGEARRMAKALHIPEPDDAHEWTTKQSSVRDVLFRKRTPELAATFALAVDVTELWFASTTKHAPGATALLLERDAEASGVRADLWRPYVDGLTSTAAIEAFGERLDRYFWKDVATTAPPPSSSAPQLAASVAPSELAATNARLLELQAERADMLEKAADCRTKAKAIRVFRKMHGEEEDKLEAVLHAAKLRGEPDPPMSDAERTKFEAAKLGLVNALEACIDDREFAAALAE
jgi:hypothetical protein